MYKVIRIVDKKELGNVSEIDLAHDLIFNDIDQRGITDEDETDQALFNDYVVEDL